jgi:hypothetical protein
MADYKVAGDDLKKLVKFSRKSPVSFGYNPGTDPDDQYLAAHKRKPPELLGKAAKTEGAGTKAAFGTFAVAGNIMSVTCVKELPGLAKRMKKLLRMNKINLNVQILDASGNVIDSDIEEMEDAFDEADDDEADDDADDADDHHGDNDAATDQSATDQSATDQLVAAAPPPTGVAPDLAARLKAMQPQVLAAPPVIAQKVTAAFKQAVGMARAGQGEGAVKLLDQIDALLARVGTIPAAPPPPPDPRLAKLRDAVAKLTQQVEMLPGSPDALLGDIDRITGQIDAGEAEAALGGLRAVQEAIKAAQAAQDRWAKAVAVLEPQVMAALSGRTVADPGDLRVKWAYVTGLAADGAVDRAIAALPPIVAILKAAAPAESDAPAANAPAADVQAADVQASGKGEPPKGIVAFQKSRILWVGARKNMIAEARNLVEAIVAQGADDDDADDIQAASDEIMAEVEQLDDRLQDILDDITNSEPGRGRDALRARAAGVVAEYQALLSSGLFARIDQNPFKPVSVAAGARAALAAISRTLA